MAHLRPLLRGAARLALAGILAGTTLAGGTITQASLNCSTGELTSQGNCFPSECDATLAVLQDCGGGTSTLCRAAGTSVAKILCRIPSTAGCCYTITLYCCDEPVESLTICCP